MAVKHTPKELNNLSRKELITMVLMMQGQLDTLNENIEKLIEQVRIANSYRFGRHSETLSSIEGQLSFFNEAEAAYDESVLYRNQNLRMFSLKNVSSYRATYTILMIYLRMFL